MIALTSFTAACAATPSTIDLSFSETFEASCLNEHRLDHDLLKEEAVRQSWQPVSDDVHPELDALTTIAREEFEDPDFPDMTMELATYQKQFGDQTLYLVLDRVSEPGLVTLGGCYLYDFDATNLPDPAAITSLLDHPFAYDTRVTGSDYYVDPSEMISVVWGPPKKYPRQFDTYLTLLPEGSPHTRKTGFSGVVLKTSQSERRDE
ncbi:MAG: hypothetical protein CMK07_12945 [Ponticaulis sp.]|nr:hypothetical protein [Ponticaulis sp.]